MELRIFCFPERAVDRSTSIGLVGRKVLRVDPEEHPRVSRRFKVRDLVRSLVMDLEYFQIGGIHLTGLELAYGAWIIPVLGYTIRNR